MMDCEKLTERQKELVKNAKIRDISAFAVAGSGKTTVLVCAYMEIIDELIKKFGSISEALDRVLVITFTDDAATEIRERIRKKLEERYDYIGDLNYISTIHSFANKILKNASVKLNIDPDYKAGDEYLNMELKISTFKEIIKNSEEMDKLMEYFNPVKIGRNDLSIGDIIFILYDKMKAMGWDFSYTILKIKETLKNYEDEEEAKKLIIEPLIKIFDVFYHNIESKKKRLGILSYDDILYYAFLALKNNLSYDYKNFEYVIVDEYQDTSYIQQEIINRIAENSKKIYAGDFFQSIYEWRDAIPREALKNVNSGNFISIEMNENFRSIPEIIDFINSLFSKIFHENIESINYINIKAIENPFDEGGVFIFKGEALNADERHKIEAENFAIAILNLLKKGKVREKDGTIRKVNMGDIAILFRSKAHMKIYSEALRKYGIKYTFIDKENFFQTTEIKIILDLFNVLNENRWQNTNDYEVAEILRYAYNFSFSNKDSDKIKKYISDMNDISKILLGKKDKIVLEFLKITNFDVLVLNDYNGIQKYLNIYRFIDLIREIEDEKILSMKEFVDILNGIIENEKVSSLPLFDLKENSVRLLSIHASKGLEFPVVFVADLQSNFRRNSDKLYLDREIGIFIDVEELINEKLSRKLEQEIQKKRLQENLRILYVAFTRAKQYLLFSLPENYNLSEKSFSDFILKNINKKDLDHYKNRALSLMEKIDYKPKTQESNDYLILPIKKMERKLPYISATDIKDFLFCPRYYHIKKRYGNLLEGENVSYGASFHKFMENLDQEDDIPDIFSNYVNFIKNHEIWNEIHADGNKIYKELEIRVKIGHTILISVLDLLSFGENSIILDYKTGSFNEFDKLQMDVYAYAFYKKFNSIPKKIAVVYLKENKIIEFYYSKDDILRTERMIFKIIRDIEAENFDMNLGNCNKCNLMNLCKKQN